MAACYPKEKSVKKVAHLQTLAGYVYFLLTGQNVLGVVPIDPNTYKTGDKVTPKDADGLVYTDHSFAGRKVAGDDTTYMPRGYGFNGSYTVKSSDVTFVAQWKQVEAVGEYNVTVEPAEQ